MKKYYDTIPMGGGGESPVEAAAKEVWIEASISKPKEGWHGGVYDGSPCVIDVDNGALIITLPNSMIINSPDVSKLKYLSKSNPVEQGQEEAWKDVIVELLGNPAPPGTSEKAEKLMNHYHLIKK